MKCKEIPNPSYLYCITCKCGLCLDCYQNAKIRKAHMGHLISKYIVLKHTYKCCLHNNKNALFYCKTCTQKICEKCLNIHKKHTFYFIKDITIYFKAYNLKKVLFPHHLNNEDQNNMLSLFNNMLSIIKLVKDDIEFIGLLLESFINFNRIEHTKKPKIIYHKDKMILKPVTEATYLPSNLKYSRFHTIDYHLLTLPLKIFQLSQGNFLIYYFDLFQEKPEVMSSDDMFYVIL